MCMSLTKQDKQDIQEIVDVTVNKAVGDLAEIISEFATNVDKRFEQVDKRFEQVDKRFEQLEGRVGRLESGQSEINAKLGLITNRLDDIDGRLMAVENDIHDIYLMLASKQDKKPIKKLKGKNLEQYVLETYNNLVAIAKEQGIKLPH